MITLHTSVDKGPLACLPMNTGGRSSPLIERETLQGRSHKVTSVLHLQRRAIKRLNTNFSEIVRECVINDLPKLIDRETKAIKARKQQLKSI